MSRTQALFLFVLGSGLLHMQAFHAHRGCAGENLM